MADFPFAEYTIPPFLIIVYAMCPFSPYMAKSSVPISLYQFAV